MKARILITGGAGYVGTVLSQVLLKESFAVRCYDSLNFGVEPVLPLFRYPDYDLVVGDVRDEVQLRSNLRDVDTIIHLAAIVGYPACKRAGNDAWDVNVNGTQALIRARSVQQPVLFASTASNYGHVPEGFCTEETPLRPLSEYGRSKTRAEQLLAEAPNTMIYRFATACGLSPRLRLDLLVNDFCYQAVRHGQVVIYEADFSRTFLHVYDMALAFRHALDRYTAMRDKIFNCGDQRLNVTKLEVAKRIQKQVASFHWEVADIGTDEDRRNYEISFDRLATTGFAATIGLDEAIAEMQRAFRFVDRKQSSGTE